MKKPKKLRWTITNAATEFAIDRRRLTQELRRTEARADAGGRFSTKQICAAVFGDAHVERLRILRSEANRAERTERIEAGRSLDADAVDKAWEEIILPAKHRLQLIPSKVQSRLALSRADARVIEQEVDEALTELSKEPEYQTEKQTSKS